MAQLAKGINGSYDKWTFGSASCGERSLPPHVLTVGVNCRIDSYEEHFMALLDTGATISIVGGELAQELLAQHEAVGETGVKSRFEGSSGPLIRIVITLLANPGDPDSGSDVEVNRTVMASADWKGPPTGTQMQWFWKDYELALNPPILRRTIFSTSANTNSHLARACTLSRNPIKALQSSYPFLGPLTGNKAATNAPSLTKLVPVH